MAELVDALVSNTCGKPCRFEPGSGYKMQGCLKSDDSLFFFHFYKSSGQLFLLFATSFATPAALFIRRPRLPAVAFPTGKSHAAAIKGFTRPSGLRVCGNHM